MRIVIDMQGAQTESRFRGIGRYTIAFAQAVVRNKGEHEVFLALSGLFSHTIEHIRADFDGMLPQENIRVWHAPSSVKAEDPNNTVRREVAEIVREAFLASMCPDIVHVSSIFEGYVDDAVTSIGLFDNCTPTSVILYDLIPLLNPSQYLKPDPNYAVYYEQKLHSLKNATQVFAISEYAKREGLECLGIDGNHIVNVSAAIGSEFKQIKVDELAKEALFRKTGIVRPFVLCTGGCDERKNLPRLVEAWSILPIEVRQAHQLLFVGRMPDSNAAELRHLAQRQRLKNDDLLISGFVSDEELIHLYNLCELFVFPSWHEGFGLSALEAMACGAPVIGSNTTSLPEVIGLVEALFDPFDVNAICSKMQEALTNQAFLIKLSDHGLQQTKRFSWDKTGQSTIRAWERLVVARSSATHGFSSSKSVSKGLIDTISPLLGKTSDDYLIDLSSKLALNECNGLERQLLVDISELVQHDAATGVQRVVRSYLKNLLKNPPKGFKVLPVYATTSDGYRVASKYVAKTFGGNGLVLDDSLIRWQRGDIFFGLDLQHHVQLSQAETYIKMRNKGVIVKFLIYDLLPIQLGQFFNNEEVKHLHKQLMQLIGQQHHAICISKATANAYQTWIKENDILHNPTLAVDWIHMGADFEGSQLTKGIPENATITLQKIKSRPTFLSVSTLEPRKLQTQILDAAEVLWANHQDINLVFVGQQGWKVKTFVERIAKHPENGQRLFWLKGISDEYLELVYQASTCLVAASINEGFGLPLIEAARHSISVIARDIPVFREVAEENAFYFNGYEGIQLAGAMTEWIQLNNKGLAPSSKNIRWLTWQQSTEQLKFALLQEDNPRRQLLVDISELVQRDARTGIQRVVRSILKEWLKNPPKGFFVEPVYATETGPYRYARDFSSKFTSGQINKQTEEPIDFSPGDIFFVLDFQPQVQRAKAHFYQHLRQQGITVKFMVYDMLSILQPEHFPEGSANNFFKWLEVVSESDGVICISQAVSNEFQSWMKLKKGARKRPFRIDVNHLGADLDSSVPMPFQPHKIDNVCTANRQRPSFLMVGTLEPRKGHTQVLDAFECLWRNNTEVNLVIVGKQGWMVDVLVERLRQHKEIGKHLFWLDGVSDDYLEMVYASSTCLIAASFGEGFGLPLIEAAQHKLPIICRDIPVFREVAGENAFYFTADGPNEIAFSIQEWLVMHAKEQHPKPDEMSWLTWKESSHFLIDLILRESSGSLSSFDVKTVRGKEGDHL